MPFLRVSLKCLKRKTFDFEPRSLGEHIRRKRLECGLTQRQLGPRLGVSGWTVANWEKGHSSPPMAATSVIVEWLGFTPHPEPEPLLKRMLVRRRSVG
ncbi:MAG: helix-turn-helix domain-containing protein [Phycisphaeraceae bacterium]|nr:helix-turn-helix domain-containing protein [Phycisphaeraceae bacterium]